MTSLNVILALRGRNIPRTYLVAISNNTQKSVKSTNKINWTGSNAWSPTSIFDGIAYSPTLGNGQGRFLACATAPVGGDLVYSDDAAVNWIAQSTGSGQNQERVMWAKSAFFVGSNNGGVFRSTTGLTSSWTNVLAGSSIFQRSYGLAEATDLSLVASCGNGFSSGGGNDTPRISYSSDGLSWSVGVVTNMTTGGGDAANTLFAIQRDPDNGLWWTLNGLGQLYSKASLSAAGNWTLVATLDASSSGGHRIAIKSGGSELVVVTGATGVWVSTDGGASFSQELTSEGLNDAIWSEYFDCFILVGSKIFTGRPGNWTEQTDEPVSTNYGAICEGLG